MTEGIIITMSNGAKHCMPMQGTPFETFKYAMRELDLDVFDVKDFQVSKDVIKTLRTRLTVALTVELTHPDDVDPSQLIEDGSFEFETYLSERIKNGLKFHRTDEELTNQISVEGVEFDDVDVESSDDDR